MILLSVFYFIVGNLMCCHPAVFCSVNVSGVEFIILFTATIGHCLLQSSYHGNHQTGNAADRCYVLTGHCMNPRVCSLFVCVYTLATVTSDVSVT